jgi:hypothetical protein
MESFVEKPFYPFCSLLMTKVSGHRPFHIGIGLGLGESLVERD